MSGPRFVFNLIRARHISRRRFIFTGVISATIGAREELARAQDALPNNAQIFNFLGLIDRRQGRWDEAIRNLERAVDLDPRNVGVINNLGEIYYNLRKYEEAIAVADRALALEPHDASLRLVQHGSGSSHTRT